MFSLINTQRRPIFQQHSGKKNLMEFIPKAKRKAKANKA